MREPASKTPFALLALLGLVLSVLAVLTIGGGADPLDGLGWVLTSAVYAGLPAGLYLAAALGYGRLIGRAVMREAEASAAWRATERAIGLGFLLTASHGLGALGLLTPMTAIGVCALGVAALVHGRFKRKPPRTASRADWRTAVFLWAALPAIGALLVAASCAPGVLWNSEYGGYDALSYHLPIVQEWIALGRTEPLQHNVYSFLPGYVESAFFHVAVMTDAPGPGGGEAWGLIAGDGWRVLGAQWLHAGITLLAAWIVAGLASGLGERAGLDEARRRLAGGVTGGLVVATPWVVVVGSLAYNEMAVVALGAGALAAAMLDGVRAMLRGAIVGGLVAAACGAKPTAIFMVAPVAGVLMLALAPRRAWPALITGGALAGVLMLAPWMLRNAAHGGNPVFPHASDIFGTAHWTTEQAARFARGHAFEGSALDRLRLALWTNPDAGPTARAVQRFRGLTNPQWGGLFLVTAAAAAWGLTRHGGCRRMTALLVFGLGLQLLAWLTMTHIQSRFLLPCLVTAAPLVGLACGGVGRRRVAIGAGGLVICAQMLATLWIWSVQAGGYPAARMIAGVRLFTGEPFVPEVHQHTPSAVTNRITGGATVYLLGGATPLYFAAPVVYHTTWDTAPLGELMRANPSDPEAWAAALRERGVAYVLADFGELDRLRASGWYDELLTPEAAMAWLDVVAEPVAGWPEQGQMLYRLRTAAEVRP